MPDPRRIVPDASVLLPAFFPDEVIRLEGREFRPARRAGQLMGAILNKVAVTFAPDALAVEFMARAFEFVHSRSLGQRLERDYVDQQVELFLRLPIIYIPATTLAALAWDLSNNASISPPDSWYLACAIYNDAELWVSHPHRDDLVDYARRHHDRVFCLSERSF